MPIQPIQLTAQLHTLANRFCEVDAAILTSVMRRDELVKDLVLACAKRIEHVTARAGKLNAVMIERLWTTNNKKGGTQRRTLGNERIR